MERKKGKVDRKKEKLPSQVNFKSVPKMSSRKRCHEKVKAKVNHQHAKYVHILIFL